MDVTVKVKIGNVEVELTLAEAAELHAALGRICGKPESVTVPMPYPVPYYVHYEPARLVDALQALTLRVEELERGRG